MVCYVRDVVCVWHAVCVKCVLCVSMHICIYMHVCVYVCMCMGLCMHMCANMYVHVCVCVYVCVCMCVCMSVCVCVYMCVYMFVCLYSVHNIQYLCLYMCDQSILPPFLLPTVLDSIGHKLRHVEQTCVTLYSTCMSYAYRVLRFMCCVFVCMYTYLCWLPHTQSQRTVDILPALVSE